MKLDALLTSAGMASALLMFMFPPKGDAAGIWWAVGSFSLIVAGIVVAMLGSFSDIGADLGTLASPL